MPPRVNRPATSPDPDGGFDLAAMFGVLIDRLGALETAIENQTNTTRSQLDQQIRLTMAGSGRQAAEGHVAGVMSQYAPRMRGDVLRSLTMTGGAPHDMTAGMTKMTGIGALTSLQNLQAFGAQRLGEWIAGTPLYESQPAHGTTPPGTRGGMTSGGTVPGAGAPAPPQPAGSGAPTAAAMPPPAATAGGAGTAAGAAAASASATGPGGGPPGGLPGIITGGGAHAAAPSPQMMNMAQNIGARVAMTGGSASGIMGALKKIPGVGLIVDAAEGIANLYTSQREAGRVYQEVEGGSNLAAQTERLHSLAYQFSMFGRMPEGAAAQAFGDVTALGYNRMAVGQAGQLQNRQSALDFIYHNYTAQGTDVQQSVQILQTASQDTAVSLKSVSDAMSTLSDMAGKAGTNAENARDNFNSLLNTAIQMGAGPAAGQLAGILATTQASGGNIFANTSFAGQVGPAEQYLLAGQYGMTPNQVQYLQRNQPGQYASMLSGSATQFIQQILGNQLYSALQQMIQQAGGANTLRSQPALLQQVANQFLNQYQSQNPILNTTALAQWMSSLSNIPLTPNTVMPWIVQQVAGLGPASNANVGSLGTSGTVSAAGAAAGNSQGAPTGRYGLATGTAAYIGPIGARTGTPQSPGQTWQQQLLGDNKVASQQYLSQEGRSGQRSPVLEALLQNVPSSTQVAVKTASGTRVMSFAQAMQYYPNEMAAGDVQFFNSNGQALGGTASFTQGLVNANAPIGSEESQKAGSNVGVSWQQYQKQHPGSTGGGVTVDLSAEARLLLKLLPSNNDQAAATSTVPAPPYVASPSR